MTTASTPNDDAADHHRPVLPIMKKLGKAFKAAAKGFADGFGSGRYQAAGRPVCCNHCNGERFMEHQALLNTKGATLAGLDWLNKSGTALLCDNCGLIQWFGKRPERR